MEENNEKSLRDRVERLEAVVAELQKALKQKEVVSGKPITEEFTAGKRQRAEHQRPVKPSDEKERWSGVSMQLPENMRSGEFWLNKIGIGLVLFGVAFLFKYSIDQGWLTPSVRVGFGMVLGLGLVLAGFRMSTERKSFSQVLIGGGIAAFYITGFAAFQLLSLVSHPVAFIFMVFVTLLAFIMSLRQEGVALSLIGVIGGLGTPFLLYTGSGSLPGLVGYTCLVIGGACAIFFFRGWRSLLWTTVAGGWLVMLVALVNARSTGPIQAASDQWSLQSGLIFCWLVFWILPFFREYAGIMFPSISGSADSVKKPTATLRSAVQHRYLHLLVVSTPVIVLVMSMQTWSLSGHTWGWIVMFGALVYGLVSTGLSRRDVIRYLSYSHALVSVVLLTYSFYLLLSGDLLLFTIAVEAAALHLLARRLPDRRITIAGHVLFGIVGLWLAQRLFAEQVEGRFIMNVQAVTDLWVIVIASLVAIFYLVPQEKKVYLLFIHIAVLGWFMREFSSILNGQGYVTISWGIYSVILLILGLRLNDSWLRSVAMFTLFIVVGKLFLVDLSQLETIWRVLLFLGFGSAFLILSYYFRSLWKAKYKPPDKLNT